MRQARPSDAPLVAALLRQAADAGASHSRALEIDEAAIAADLAEGDGLRIVAERSGGVVGYLELRPGQGHAYSRTGQLQLAVNPEVRGRGIGAELVRHALAWAEGGALDRVEAFVRATNEKALKLYDRFGLEVEARLRGRVREPDDSYIDDIVVSRITTLKSE